MWTPDKDRYLLAHYAADGAAKVAEAIGLSHEQVLSKASEMGVTISPSTKRRLVHNAAQEHMIKHNPMRREESKAKVREWHATHPDEVAEIRSRVLAGRARRERVKPPSELERYLRDLLDNFGVAYESAVLIDGKYLVDICIGTIVIEADGNYWHGHPSITRLTERQAMQRERDIAKDAALHALGYTVVRIWESELTHANVGAVLREHGLITEAQVLSSHPTPLREERVIGRAKHRVAIRTHPL